MSTLTLGLASVNCWARTGKYFSVRYITRSVTGPLDCVPAPAPLPPLSPAGPQAATPARLNPARAPTAARMAPRRVPRLAAMTPRAPVPARLILVVPLSSACVRLCGQSQTFSQLRLAAER